MTALTADVDHLASAYHEVGHGIAAKHGGLTVNYLRVVRRRWRGGTEGWCNLQAPTLQGPQWALDAYVVYLLAGGIAQARALEGMGVQPCDAERFAAGGAAHDHAVWAEYAEVSTLTWDGAWHAAADIVTGYWDHIEYHGHRLAKAGRIPGSQL